MEEHDLHRLLARGGLSGQQREDVLRSVLRETPRRRRPAWVGGRLWAALGAAGLIGGVALLAPALLAPSLERRASGLRPKGGASTPLRVEIACRGGSLAACPLGSVLLLGVDLDGPRPVSGRA
jgi:hypothetical protein